MIHVKDSPSYHLLPMGNRLVDLDFLGFVKTEICCKESKRLPESHGKILMLPTWWSPQHQTPKKRPLKNLEASKNLLLLRGGNGVVRRKKKRPPQMQHLQNPSKCDDLSSSDLAACRNAGVLLALEKWCSQLQHSLTASQQLAPRKSSRISTKDLTMPPGIQPNPGSISKECKKTKTDFGRKKHSREHVGNINLQNYCSKRLPGFIPGRFFKKLFRSWYHSQKRPIHWSCRLVFQWFS